jgi:hypothetical protein
MLERSNYLSRVEIETPELNEQAWADWVQKGKLRDRVLARRWKIITGILGAPVGDYLCSLRIAGSELTEARCGATIYRAQISANRANTIPRSLCHSVSR